MKVLDKVMYVVFIAIFVICLLLLTSLEFESTFTNLIKDALMILVLLIDSLVLWLKY